MIKWILCCFCFLLDVVFCWFIYGLLYSMRYRWHLMILWMFLCTLCMGNLVAWCSLGKMLLYVVLSTFVRICTPYFEKALGSPLAFRLRQYRTFRLLSPFARDNYGIGYNFFGSGRIGFRVAGQIATPTFMQTQRCQLACDLAVDGSPKSNTFISPLNFTPSGKCYKIMNTNHCLIIRVYIIT